MSSTGKGKKREEQDQASDGDSEGHAPPKKTQKKDSNDDADTITICEIGKNRKVTVRIWQGKIWVDIREFYNKDGKDLPGKKGISLSIDQWNVLRDHIEAIDQAVGDKS